MEELVKEQPVYEIQKVKIKNNQLTAEYTEKFVEANYKNNILKESEQFIHPDLLYALNRLKPHVVKICEMHEATLVNVANPSDDDLNEKLKNIIVTGYSKGGNDESAGVSIQAQKLLKSGQILNLSVPFTKYEDESGDGYLYGAELKEAIGRCSYEVDAYLFEGKYGIKQESFDFDTPEESDITGEKEEKPKKRGRKKKEQIKEIAEMGVQIGIVIGGGNIFRGLSGASKGFDRVKGDQMGMLATVINSLALSSALVAQGVNAKVLTAIRMEPIGEFYNKWRAIELLEQGNVVIMSGGTGNPFFTTDTGSSLRGIEIEADVMLKGTRVDGIYTADPEKDPTATKFSDITYDEIYTRGLKVMDLTATTMCKENNLPIIVFDMDTNGNLKKVMSGENIGTLVHN